jgi:hypothetical protein
MKTLKTLALLMTVAAGLAFGTTSSAEAGNFHGKFNVRKHHHFNKLSSFKKHTLFSHQKFNHHEFKKFNKFHNHSHKQHNFGIHFGFGNKHHHH